MSSFALALNEMRNHYKNNIKNEKISRYIPSKEHITFHQNQETKGLSNNDQEVVAGLQLYSQNLAQKESSDIEGGITDSTQTYKDSVITDASAQTRFKDELNRKREEAKRQAIDNVDRVYDEALRIGEAHPEAQAAIMGVLDLAGIFFQNLFEKIASFVSSIVQSVVEWVANAWSSIKSTFNSIGSWISSWF
ncbi:hypothetical protein [Chromobacterium haemolyticum]|uniref:hypothetical protein n=1 Tax=Chromobacterium TaxID=535 RepID=UPI0040561B30